MRTLEHTADAVERAHIERERAKLRVYMVHAAIRYAGTETTRACAAARVAYHQASLALLVAMTRHVRWHRATHRAAMRRAA